ncbi:MAG: hypothetical protein EXS09_19230 [Gemmataceae bacterium]|nr:hypothetical protein [Gemmataceae bacterium]
MKATHTGRPPPTVPILEWELIPVMSRVSSAVRRFLHGLSSESRAGLFGLVWSYLTHGLQLFLRFGSSLVLTWILLPDAYGIFGPALAVMLLIELLSDLGVRPAVVRSSRGEDPAFLGTAWSILLLRSVPFAATIIALAWALPAWYGKPALFGVMLALSVRPILVALQNPTLFVLYRQLNYKTPFYLDTLQTVIAIPITILFALYFRNEWGLVLGLLCGDVARGILSHILCPRAPRPCWDRLAVKELSNFGLPIFLNTLAYGAWVYFDRIAGPKVFDEREIGLYILAWSLAEAMDVLISRGSEVFYSMLSRQPERDLRSALFRRTARRVALYLIPSLVIAALVAPWAFMLVYRAEYHGAAILFGLLTARLIMRATAQLQFMYLMMRGQVILATRSYLVSFIILASTFLLWVQVLDLGVLGLAISSLVGMTTFTLTQTFQMVRRGEASPWPMLAGLFWTTIAVAGVLLIYLA